MNKKIEDQLQEIYEEKQLKSSDLDDIEISPEFKSRMMAQFESMTEPQKKRIFLRPRTLVRALALASALFISFIFRDKFTNLLKPQNPNNPDYSESVVHPVGDKQEGNIIVSEKPVKEIELDINKITNKGYKILTKGESDYIFTNDRNEEFALKYIKLDDYESPSDKVEIKQIDYKGKLINIFAIDKNYVYWEHDGHIIELESFASEEELIELSKTIID